MIEFANLYTPIPRKLHQIWYQGASEVPEKLQHMQLTWKEKHPHWIYTLWDQDSMLNYIQDNFPEAVTTWQNFPYMHQKIDFFKYLVLYNDGGVYVDMDTLCLKSLDELLDQFPRAGVILSYIWAHPIESYITMGYSKSVNNGTIMSVPGHPLMKNLIDRILSLNPSHVYFTKYQSINNTTGPYLFNQVIDSFRSDPSVLLLPSKYLEPCYTLDKDCKPGSSSFIDHQHAQTWMPKGLLVLIGAYYKMKSFASKNLSLIFIILLGIVFLLFTWTKI